MMVKYEFDIPPDMIDELVRMFCPRELADYLYKNYNNYSLDLQWELDTLRLDNVFEGYDSYEEYENAQQSLFPDPYK